jgi:hypothetical protein
MFQKKGGRNDICSEALIIYGIHEYIAVLMNFGNFMGISRVLLNFCSFEFLVQYCQKRSSPVCMVMNKLPSHPPVFILTPSRRSTLICIYHPDPIPSSII